MHIKTTSHPLGWLQLKNKQTRKIACVGKDVEKLAPLCIAGRNGKWLWKMVWWFFQKLNMKLPYDLAIVFLGFYDKILKIGLQTNICV